MANLPPVRVALVPKGAHSASSAYSFLDIVKYDGKSYVCKVFDGITAKAFTAVDWFELCADGLKGAKGDTGLKGDPGMPMRGNWAVGVSYTPLDVISYTDGVWLCKIAHTAAAASAPAANSAYWASVTTTVITRKAGRPA